MPPIMGLIAFALALASITVSAAAVAFPKVSKVVYGLDGRRVAVIKRIAFGTKVYGQDGRRVATIRSR